MIFFHPFQEIKIDMVGMRIPPAHPIHQSHQTLVIAQETEVGEKASVFVIDLERAAADGAEGAVFADSMSHLINLLRNGHTSQVYMPSSNEEDGMRGDEARNAAAWSILETYGFTQTYHFTVPPGKEAYVRNLEASSELVILPAPCTLVYLNLCLA